MYHMKTICTLALCAWTATGVGTAATDVEQCHEMIRHALESNNPDTRKSAVVALSLAATDTLLLKELAGMLEDKDVEVRVAV